MGNEMVAPSWWTQRRFGMLVHANLATVPAWAPIGQYAGWYQAHVDGHVPDVLLQPSPLAETLAHHRDRWAHIERYDDFFPFLTFDEFDADAWTGLARDTGMGYAVMTAKHHDGLCWWDAPNTDRTVLHDGPARNVLGEFAAACERADLVFGTHYSLLDWADPRYPSDAYVDEVVHPQVLDLVQRYGSRMLWGDGHWGAGGSHWRSNELTAAARRIDPEIVVNDRWWSDQPDVRSFEYQLPDGILDEPWELRRALGPSMGHNRAESSEHLLTAPQIVSLLTEVVAKGGHLLLSLGPDAAGRIPEPHGERLRAAGGWIRRHRDLVDRGAPWTTWGDADCRYLVLDDVLHVVDISGRGRFAALARTVGNVTAVDSIDGAPVAFEQHDRDLRLERPPRKPQRLPMVYRITIDRPPPAPIELFPDAPPPRLELADALADARSGAIVQLGDGTYVGPARIPDGVTLRGLGAHRTRIDGLESEAVVLGAGARLEHCSLHGGGKRIAWIPKLVVRVAGTGATMLGCHVDGHVQVVADDARVTSCTAAGVVVEGANRAQLARSAFRGMQWDCAVDISGGSGHVVESCEFADVLAAIRLTGTIGATVRGNRVAARWWGTQLVDTEGTLVIGNSFEHTMRAVDIDGGTLAEVTGNAAIAGDSGCVLQHGASECEIAGNHWERCRIGLLAWDAGAFRHHDNACIDPGEPNNAVTIGP
jgi:alpha-L-fucosidase